MKFEKVFWGIFFVMCAVFMLVSTMGYLQGFSFWTILLTVFLAACLAKSIFHRSITGMLFSVAFLGIVYAVPLGITAITPWPILGAAAFASIGLNMLFRPRKWGIHSVVHHNHHDDYETIDEVNGNSVNFETSFGSSIKYVNSDNFERANIECSFGAMQVYFDNAVIPSGNATIVLDVSFSGVELYFPKSWNVKNKMDVSFGAVEENNSSMSNGTPVVTLVGDASFCGVEITYI